MEIRLDDASSFLLPEDQVAVLGLSAGEEIHADRLREVERAAGRAEAMRIALRYLSARPRSRHELRLRLRRKGAADGAIEAALARCEELGYLDDRAFAAAYARDRIRLRPSGIRRMKDDLRGKGVSETEAVAGIRDALDEEEADEAELLERAARGRARRLAALEPEVAARRLFAFLTRRGFAPADATAWMDAEWRHPGSDEPARHGHERRDQRRDERRDQRGDGGR